MSEVEWLGGPQDGLLQAVPEGTKFIRIYEMSFPPRYMEPHDKWTFNEVHQNISRVPIRTHHGRLVLAWDEREAEQ